MTVAELAASGLHIRNLDSNQPTLYIDGSGIEAIERCRRYSQYLLVLRRESAGVNFDLFWGKLMHACWQLWAQRDGAAPASEDTQALQERLINDTFANYHASNGDLPEREWRTEGRAIEFIAAWNEHYRKRWAKGPPFEVLGAEVRFGRPLGVIDGVLDKPVAVHYCGIIDLALTDNEGRVWIKDYKTGRSYRPELIEPAYGNSSQFKGYCWELHQRAGKWPEGVIIQSAICNYPRERPTAKSPAPNQFEADVIRYTRGAIDNWQVNTLALLRGWLLDAASGYWPMSGGSCSKYGRKCQFWDVCMADTWADSLAWLASGQYQDYTWDPLATTQSDRVKVGSYADLTTTPVPYVPPDSRN